MRAITRLAVALAAMLMLLDPALWNGFPLLQYDTGGYIARWYEGTLEQSRSTVYGLFLNALTWPDFWPAIAVQAALTVWVLSLVLRVQGLGDRVAALIITVAVLCIATTLPWLASLLLTDIFAGLAVLALYLTVLHGDTLRPWERGALLLLIAFSAATHSATLAVLLALLAAGLLVAFYDPRLVPFARPAQNLGALVVGAAMLLAADYVVAGRLAWTPGGISLSFGRMLNDGIVTRYLDEHCPDPRFRLCEHRSELPANADVFFWGSDLFNRLGRFDGMNDEMRTIELESLRDYPALQFEMALRAFGSQLVEVATGYGVNNEIWHTHGMIQNFLPAIYPDMKAARQQTGGLETVFPTINRVHVPIAYASMLALLGVIALGFFRAGFSDLAYLAVTVALALLANAAVLGILSGPHDRYGARMLWLATLVVLILPWRAAQRR